LLQRKVLTPNDSADLQELELRIRLYEELTNREPKPFDWKFTKNDLFDLLQRLARREVARKASSSATLISPACLGHRRSNPTAICRMDHLAWKSAMGNRTNSARATPSGRARATARRSAARSCRSRFISGTWRASSDSSRSF